MSDNVNDGANNTINWNSLKKRAEDATRPPEPGWYVLECAKAELKSSKNGNPMIAAQFKVVEGPAAGKSGIFNNFNVIPDNDFALAMFFRQMAAFGFNDAFFNTNPSLELVTAQLVGRRANVKLTNRDYQGQPRANFDDVRPLDGLVINANPPVGPSINADPWASAGPSVPGPVDVPNVVNVPSPSAPPALPI